MVVDNSFVCGIENINRIKSVFAKTLLSTRSFQSGDIDLKWSNIERRNVLDIIQLCL